MHITELILLRGARLDDANWAMRFASPRLDKCFCLLGGNAASTVISFNTQNILLGPNQMALLPPGRVALERLQREEGVFLGAVFFYPGFFTGVENVLSLLEKNSEFLIVEDMWQVFSQFEEYIRNGGVLEMQAANHLLCSFLYRLATLVKEDQAGGGADRHVETALELMHMHQDGSLTLEDIGAALHVSPAHFGRIFRDKMGMPPMKYYKRLMMNNAAALILRGHKIKDVAEKTGFYNDAHFSQQFKQFMGVPPREYKLEHLAGLTAKNLENARSLSIMSSMLQEVIDAMPDLIFFKDVFLVIRMCNQAFCDLAGKSREQIIGLTDLNLFPPDMAKSFRERDEIIIKTLQPHSNAEWVTYPDGRKALLEAFKAPYFDTQGELLGVVGVSRDITARS